MSTYIGVSHQYKIEGPGGTRAHRVRAEPRCGGAARTRGEKVRLDVAPRAHVRGPAFRPHASRTGGRGMTDEPVIDPSLLRGSDAVAAFTRRDLFRYAGVAGGALGLSAILAACGTKGVATGSAAPAKPNANMGTAAWWGQADAAPHARTSTNWPYYMDIGANGSAPVARRVHEEDRDQGQLHRADPGQPVVLDQHILPAAPRRGSPRGTTSSCSRTTTTPLGYMLELRLGAPARPRRDAELRQVRQQARHEPVVGPRQHVHDGLAVGVHAASPTTRSTSRRDHEHPVLWDPKYKGKIGMFGNASELGCLGLLALGKDPRPRHPTTGPRRPRSSRSRSRSCAPTTTRATSRR